MEFPHRLAVGREQACRRLDLFLAGLFPALSRSAWQRLIRAGGVRVNGRRVKTGLMVEEGMMIDIEAPAQPAADQGIIPVRVDLNVLYEDDQALVLCKPAGVSVHASGSGDRQPTLAAAVAARYGALSSMGGAFRPGVVHRLDRDTSGVLIMARNDIAHAFLAAQFAARSAKKTYLAVVLGVVEFDEDIINAPIGRHSKHREMMVIRSNGRSAQTRYRTLERFDGYTLVELEPETGRTHQIRVHMRRIGHPVAGDALYGRGPVKVHEITGRGEGVAMGRQALHAQRLQIELPGGKGRRVFVAPWPEDIFAFVELLRRHRKR